MKTAHDFIQTLKIGANAGEQTRCEFCVYNDRQLACPYQASSVKERHPQIHRLHPHSHPCPYLALHHECLCLNFLRLHPHISPVSCKEEQRTLQARSSRPVVVVLWWTGAAAPPHPHHSLLRGVRGVRAAQTARLAPAR